MPTQQHINQAKVDFDTAKQHLLEEFSKLQIGRATAGLVEDVQVETYGTKQPLKAVATISCPDPRTIQIQPWDRGNLNQIEVGIKNSGLSLTTTNDGIVIRINIPSLTEERRTELTKIVHKLAEDARITVRNHRQTAHESFKKQQADKVISEDDFHAANKKLQDEVDKVNKEIEEMAKTKEKDIMTV